MVEYKCLTCNHVEETIEGATVSTENFKKPEICPKCQGKMEKSFSCAGQSFDIVGYCYMNAYGKHNWKKGKSQKQIADVYAGTASPY